MRPSHFHRGRCLPRRLSLLLLTLTILISSAHGQTYTGVVVFGDSLSDTGNIAHLSQARFGSRFPSYIPLLSNYTDGRFTDGTDTSPAASAYLGVWVEQLAPLFRLPSPLKNSLDGGTNYAYGDATTNDGTRTVSEAGFSLTLNNMGQQVSDYLATNPTPTPQTLYVLWGGSNDVYADQSAAGVASAVAREVALVQRLVAVGATSFLVPDLPPLGGVPDHASDPTSAATLNSAAASFDAQLAAGLNGIILSAKAQGKAVVILQPDIFTLFSTVATNPSAVGLVDVSAAAQGVTGNPDTYLIWDGLHPTTTGHHFVAATVAQLIAPLRASTNALSVVPNTISPGQSVILTATVASSTGTPVAPDVAPTGLVTFFSNGTTAIGSATLIPGNGVSTATTKWSAAALSSSPYNITAVYAGDVIYNVSISAAQAVPVTLVSTTTTVSSSNLNANLGASVTFTATVAPISGTQTGTVIFRDGTTTLGAPVAVANGIASYTTTSFTSGTHTISAVYSGDASFMGSTSASITQVISAPSFTASLTPTSVTIARGATGTTTLTLTPVGGYTGTATLTCGTLSAHLACTFAPSSANLAGTAAVTATLTIATNASAALIVPQHLGASHSSAVTTALLFPGMSFLGLTALRRRRRRSIARDPHLLLALLVFSAALLGVSGCGGSNNTATGTYTVPITATAGATTSTANLTVVVQ